MERPVVHLSKVARRTRAGPIFLALLATLSLLPRGTAIARDLDTIRKDGVLRHIGIPYANFVTGGGDGMDVELVQRFAAKLGVRYEFVPSDWSSVIGDLTGRSVRVRGKDVEFLSDVPVKGDLIANGMTILPWRQKVVEFSEPVFPTQVWVIARADSPVRPIRPTGNLQEDIDLVKRLFRKRSLLTAENTCLDPALYDLDRTGADILLFPGQLDELAPALMRKKAELSLLDVPDALIALEKWPGQIKVIGPLSGKQEMAVAFRKDSPQLREAFNAFLVESRGNGFYDRLVQKYYPYVFNYYPEFFRKGK
jgi:ABC-type amino acid transport substrate-binding protein